MLAAIVLVSACVVSVHGNLVLKDAHVTPAWTLPLPTDTYSYVSSSKGWIFLCDHHSVQCINDSTGKIAWTSSIKSFRKGNEGERYSVLPFSQYLLVWSNFGAGQVDVLDQTSGKVLTSLRLSGSTIEAANVFDDFALLSVRKGDGDNFGLVSVEIEKPGAPVIKENVTGTLLSHVTVDNITFGGQLYKIRNKGTKTAFLQKIRIDKVTHPSESTTKCIYLLPDSWHGIVTISRFDDPRRPEVERPEFSISRWSSDLSRRYWTYSAYVGDPESSAAAFASDVVTWHNKVWINTSRGVLRMGKGLEEGFQPVAAIDQVFKIEDSLFALSGPADLARSRTTRLYRSADGTKFNLIGNLPDLPSSKSVDFDLKPVADGLTRIVRWKNGEQTSRRLEFYRLKH
jgi:hypothetical protein